MDKRLAITARPYFNARGPDMASDGNIKSAAKTYESFIGVMKWGTIASVAVAAIVVLLISS